MPHMNRLRLVNVAFNNANSFFDDFRLNLVSKSTTYDLENGGGKSVLLMMMLQTVIPNISLREDKPLKNIFAGGKDRTSHVLVEWTLDEGERYKYMLTGFCARKKRSHTEAQSLDEAAIDQDEDITSEGIDYYNYVIFYQEPTEYDIDTMELVKEGKTGKTYIGYDELRAELKRLKQRGIPVTIYDRKGEYMEHIEHHNLLSTEWKIIREINSGENSIEKYFRENKTSRRLIENLLLRIVDDTEGVRKSSKFNDGGNLQLAETLLEIRENLARLMKDKEHLGEYSQILNFYDRMLKTCKRMEEDFRQGEQLKQHAVKLKNLLAEMQDKQLTEKTSLEGLQSEKIENNKKTEYEMKLLEIQLLEFDKLVLLQQQQVVKAAQDSLKIEQQSQDSAYKEAGARREYVQYKNEKQRQQQEIKTLEGLSKDRDELAQAYNEAGSRYKAALNSLCKDFIGKIDEASNKIDEHGKAGELIDIRINHARESLGAATTNREHSTNHSNKLDVSIKKLANYFNENGRTDIILDQSSFLSAAAKKLAVLEETSIKIDAAAVKIGTDIEQSNRDILDIKHQIERLAWQTKGPEDYLSQFEQEGKKLNQLTDFYDCINSDDLSNRLSEHLNTNSEQLFKKKMDRGVKLRKLELLKTHGFYIPNEEIFALTDKLKGKCAFTQAGIEWLNSLDETEREQWLDRIPLLHYGVLIDHEAFTKIKSGRLDFGGFISDYPVPILDVDIIRGQEALNLEEVIFSGTDKNLIISFDALEAYKKELHRVLEKIQADMVLLEDKSRTYNEDFKYLTEFNKRYSKDKIAEQKDLLKSIRTAIAENEGKDGMLKKQLAEQRSKEQQLKLDKARILDELHSFQEQRAKAEELLALNAEVSAANKSLRIIEQELNRLQQELKGLDQEKVSAKNKNEHLEDQRKGLERELIRYEDQLLRVAAFEDKENDSENDKKFDNDIDNETDNNIVIIHIDFESVKSDFDALDELLKGRNQEEYRIRERISAHGEMMKKCSENMVEHYGYTVDIMEQRELSGELLTAPESKHIQSLKSSVEKLEKEIKSKQVEYDELQNTISRLDGSIKTKRGLLGEDLHIDLAKYEHRYQIEKDIEEAKQIIELYKRELEELDKQLKSMEDKIRTTQSELGRYQEFIQKENIRYNSVEPAMEVESYQKFSDHFYSHLHHIKEWEQSWRRTLKGIVNEAQGFYIKDPVSELERLDAPATLESCTLLIEQLDNSMVIIDEKIQKIQKDIDVLQSYQEEFVRRCIQRADSVLDILKKLPALSRIDVDGTKINMIRMDFSDFDDKEKEMRMENHIRSIVREISEEGIIDRNHIAMRLATKELLAQVTNMEKAIVRLYKVENIREHSRYLKWDNAVGSEGQSNALYFIFAVCLISYIRMLSSVNVSVKTKKVIIADNPFGATSAVYLWDPMFKILASNDVQLIAPGHHIPRELTSKFEVNYLLNQDILADASIKVVVKDVRTEEDLNQMNFEKLEQMSLF